MGRVISFASGKGGVSKSVLAMNLARGLQRRGRSVVLIDQDEQKTLTIWRSVAAEGMPEVLHLDGRVLVRRCEDLRAEYDFTIIDTPPGIRPEVRLAIKAADRLLIPLRPSSADLWSTRSIVELATIRQAEDPSFAAGLVLTQVITGTNLARAVSDVLEAGSYLGLPLLHSTTASRVAYAEAIGAGCTVYEMHDVKARKELETFTNEIEHDEWPTRN